MPLNYFPAQQWTVCLSSERGEQMTYEEQTLNFLSFCGKQQWEGWQEATVSSWQIINDFIYFLLIHLCWRELIKSLVMESWDDTTPLLTCLTSLSFFLFLPCLSSHTLPLLISPLSPSFFQPCICQARSCVTRVTVNWDDAGGRQGPRRAGPRCVFVCSLVFSFAYVYVDACGSPRARIRAGSCAPGLVSAIWI